MKMDESVFVLDEGPSFDSLLLSFFELFVEFDVDGGVGVGDCG